MKSTCKADPRATGCRIRQPITHPRSSRLHCDPAILDPIHLAWCRCNDGVGDVTVYRYWDGGVVVRGSASGLDLCEDCIGGGDGGVGDFDGDGLTDVSGRGGYIYLSEVGRSMFISFYWDQAVMCDWNDDGFDDLLVSNFENSGSRVIFGGNTAPPAHADAIR